MTSRVNIVSLRAPSILAWVILLLIIASPAHGTITVIDYYRMGEGEGALGLANDFDDSVGTKHITTSGGPFRASVVSTEAADLVESSRSMWNFGHTSGSASLLSTVVNNFGLEVWVRPGSVSSSNRCIAYNGSAGTNGWGLYQVGNTFQGRIGSIFFGSGTATAGTWTHLALVRNSGTATLYVNGLAAGNSTATPTTPTGVFGVAAAPPGLNTDYLGANGYLDELRFFTFTAGAFTTNDLLWNAPEIGVLQAGTSLTDSNTVNFGSVSLGTNASLTFTITNSGVSSLTGVAVTIDGTDAARFSVTTNPASTVAVNGSTTFTVRFTPTNGVTKTAVLHIANNDPTESPFDLVLTGSSPFRGAISIEQPAGTGFTNGTVVGWGADSPPAGLTNIQAIAAGVNHTLALKSDGKVVAWGDNAAGQTNVPAGLTNVTAIAGGFQFSMALRSNGTLAVWGSNGNGQTNPPASVTNVVAISAGASHAVALRSNGTVVAWGNNSNNQTNVPAGLTNVQAIVAGANHTLALKTNGTVVAWGYNWGGQTNVPAGLTNVMAVAAGNGFSAALKSNGTVVVWGSNSYGETNVPAGLSNVTAIAGGSRHILALKNDSTVVAWGYNIDGQTNVPSGLAGVQAVTAGGIDRSAALVDYYRTFGYQAPGTTSAAKTFTIKNTGLDTLTITNVTVTGGNASDFAVNTNGMVTSIAPSGQTTFTVTFTPGATGSRVTTLRVLNNSTNQSTFDIALTGIGSVPEIAVSQPAGFNLVDGEYQKYFGDIMVGQSSDLVFLITNSGAADLTGLGITIDGDNASQFTVVTNPVVPVLPNGSTTFAVRFTPTNSGFQTAALHVASNDEDESPFDIFLAGSGLIQPDISVFDGASTNLANERTNNVGTFTFPATLISNSAVQTFTIANTGIIPLTNITLSKSGTHSNQFTLGGLGATELAPGATTTFNVTFAPSAVGVKTAVVAIASSDEDESSFQINLRGTSYSTNANLSALSCSRGTMTPVFSTAITNYTTSIRYNLTNVTVTPTLADGSASLQVRINGGSYTTNGPLTLSPGVNVMDVRVTAQDNTTTKTYTITFIRRPYGPGDVMAGFDPNADQDVHAMALQPDGKILIGGEFEQMGGVPRDYIARLNADGTPDTDFNPGADDYVYCFAVQPDGKIMAAGDIGIIGGVTRNGIARLNTNGTVDTSFNAGTHISIYCLTPLPNGQILVGGEFTEIGGIARTNVALLNSDGSGDTNFICNANDYLYAIAVQPDGKTIIGGDFATVNGVSHPYIARLNTNGSVDTNFNASANSSVYSIVLQPDGKILLGGDFTMVNGEAHKSVARLNADGTIDSSFAPVFNTEFNTEFVEALALQADGKILAGGFIYSVNGSPRGHIARLQADGSLDTAFDPDANYGVQSITIRPDGKVIIGGKFTDVGDFARNYIALLENDVATQTLAASSPSRVEWMRGGASPEASHVTFEVSTDGGTNYSALGSGTRISGGWELTGLNLPASGLLRARARTGGGEFEAGSSLLETVVSFSGLVTSVPTINPQSLTTLGNSTFRFSFTNSGGADYSVIASTNLSLPLTNWSVLGTASNIGGGIYQFTDPVGGSSQRFYRLRNP